MNSVVFGLSSSESLKGVSSCFFCIKSQFLTSKSPADCFFGRFECVFFTCSSCGWIFVTTSEEVSTTVHSPTNGSLISGFSSSAGFFSAFVAFGLLLAPGLIPSSFRIVRSSSSASIFCLCSFLFLRWSFEIDRITEFLCFADSSWFFLEILLSSTNCKRTLLVWCCQISIISRYSQVHRIYTNILPYCSLRFELSVRMFTKR